ncbi:uncharacterized protein [Antennarius striatus]|uniref:uncharacterized protein n=1 Tax=Antennarius striatus TaxID=241820 RepID=UPI0035B4DDF1
MLTMSSDAIGSTSSSIMNLCFGGFVLLAGVFLSVSALTPEECQPLITPVSLADHSVIYGRHNFLAGYTDHEAMIAVVKVTESSWVSFSASESNPNEVVMFEDNKMNGQCYESRVNMLIEGDKVKMLLTNWTSEIDLLPSVDGCYALHSTSTISQIDPFLQMLNIDKTFGDVEFRAQAFYLMCKQSSVTDSDLESFKKQAGCLGYSGEPTFKHEPQNGFCTEGAGIFLDF